MVSDSFPDPRASAGELIARPGSPATYLGIDVVIAAVVALGEVTLGEVAARLRVAPAELEDQWSEAQQLQLIVATRVCPASGEQRFTLSTRAALVQITE